MSDLAELISGFHRSSSIIILLKHESLEFAVGPARFPLGGDQFARGLGRGRDEPLRRAHVVVAGGQAGAGGGGGDHARPISGLR